MPSPHQEKIKMINNKVALVEPDRNALLKTDLQSSIAKLEEVWEGHRDAGDIEKNMGILIIFKKRNGDDVDMSLYIYIFHWYFINGDSSGYSSINVSMLMLFPDAVSSLWHVLACCVQARWAPWSMSCGRPFRLIIIMRSLGFELVYGGISMYWRMKSGLGTPNGSQSDGFKAQMTSPQKSARADVIACTVR